MSELTLYGDAHWESPWAFHAMIALDELKVSYKLEPLKFPIAADIKAKLAERAYLGKVPCLVHGDFWLTESSAVSEYLADTFAPPAYPRIYPGDARERARARQVMSWLRTSLFALREDRPTSSVFLRPITMPLTPAGQADAEQLIKVAERLVPEGRTTICSDWSMADIDLALALTRLIANNDPMPERMVDYAMAQWGRQSVRRYLAHIPTIH